MVDWLAGKRIKGTSSERTSLQDPVLGGTGVGGWVEVGRATVTSGSTADIDVTSLPNKRYYMVLTHLVDAVSGQDITPCYRFGSNGNTIDTGNNYAKSWSGNGSTPDSTQASQSRILTDSGYDVPNCFMVGYIANYSNSEKLLINHSVPSLTGANAPYRAELAGKWVNGYPIDKIRINEFDNRTAFDNGSQVVVLGYDPADTHTNNFWEELASVEQASPASSLSTGTFTAKKYLWIQMTHEQTVDSDFLLRFNSSQSSYARRRSINGGTDVTGTGLSSLILTSAATGGVNRMGFTNMFIINNQSHEKLVIGHTVYRYSADATVAPVRQEFTGKWVNTTDQITSFSITSGSGNMTTNTRIKVWGAD